MTDLPEAELLREIEAFCESANMTVTAFGVAALNDRALVSNLRNGRDLRTTTKNRIRAFMADRQPPQAAE